MRETDGGRGFPKLTVARRSLGLEGSRDDDVAQLHKITWPVCALSTASAPHEIRNEVGDR